MLEIIKKIYYFFKSLFIKKSSVNTTDYCPYAYPSVPVIRREEVPKKTEDEIRKSIERARNELFKAQLFYSGIYYDAAYQNKEKGNFAKAGESFQYSRIHLLYAKSHAATEADMLEVTKRKKKVEAEMIKIHYQFKPW